MTEGTLSTELYQRAQRRTPTGTHSNTRMRSPHPHYIERAAGAHVIDVDQRRWLDFVMGNGSIVLGHADPQVQEAVRRAADRGVTTGFESPDAVACAELLATIVPGLDAIRFANTGTEAVLHALQIARAATGRHRVAKAEASYHGWADTVWVSTWPPLTSAGPAERPAPVPGSAGLAKDASDTLILPFNDLGASTELLETHGDQLAAVIVEPAMIDIGYVPAAQDYLDGLRALTSRLGIVLIFDELLTGFRVAPGGARELYGITPDLTTYGKAIANGYPLAAVEGRRELLELSDPAKGGEVGWVGTYNAHAIAMAAARATLEQLASGQVQAYLEALTGTLRTAVAQLATSYQQPVVLSGQGGHFQPYFCLDAPGNYRDATATDTARYRAFVTACDDDQMIVASSPLGHSALSAAHTDSDIERLAASLEKTLAASAETHRP